MKNITLSADENLIELARADARARKTTLNSMFREWLAEIAERDEALKRAEASIQQLSKSLSFDRKFTRDEMNER